MRLKKFLTIIIIALVSVNFFSLITIYKNDDIAAFLYDDINKIQKSSLPSGIILDLSQIDDELCYLVLGTIRNYSAIQDLFSDIGALLKNKGFDFVIFGILDIIDESKDNKLDYIGRSPYLVSEIHYRMIRGFETAGLVPFIQVKKNDNKSVVDSLLQKSGSFFSYSEDIEDVDIFNKNGDIHLKTNAVLSFPWIITQSDLTNNLTYLYENSIVLSGFRNTGEKILYREINYTDEKSVIYFSKSVKEKAEKVFSGELNSTGNKNW